MNCCLGRRHTGRRINMGAVPPEPAPQPTPYYGPLAPGYEYAPVDDPGQTYVNAVLHPQYVGDGDPTPRKSNNGLVVGGALLGLAALLAAFG